MPASFLLELVGEVVLKPALELVLHNALQLKHLNRIDHLLTGHTWAWVKAVGRFGWRSVDGVGASSSRIKEATPVLFSTESP